MTFQWTEVGSAPDSDEVEITVFGPGHGESIVVHLGQGEWLIADSCLDRSIDGNPPAPLHYLQTIGVDTQTAVKYVVATHWDDDHIRGIGEVLRASPAAYFVCPQVYSRNKFASFIEARFGQGRMTEGGNVANMRTVFLLLNQRKQTLKRASQGRLLCREPEIICWSPSDADEEAFLAYIADMHPKCGEQIKKAIPITPNRASLVMTIKWDGFSALLGADMETHGDASTGWGAVVAEANRLQASRSDFVKIPHHGSHTGHDDRMWSELLHPGPISVVTPFGKGPVKQRPPKSSDIKRLRERSGRLFISARHSIKKTSGRGWGIERSLRETGIKLSSRKRPMGIVRHRRRAGSTEWESEFFGAAYRSK